MISCILLSAGLSSRFGSPKALASLHKQTVVEHIQHMLLSTQVAEIIIVLGHEPEKIKPFILKHKKTKVVYNKDYIFGQTSSFQAGLKHVDEKSLGVMLLPVDYPFIKRETIDSLVESFAKKKCFILIPAFEDRYGHPPVFRTILKDEIFGISQSVGLNSIAHKHKEKTVILPVSDNGILKTFNTQEEFERLKENGK